MKVNKILFAILIAACFIGTAQADCFDVLKACWDLGGSNDLCELLLERCSE